MQTSISVPEPQSQPLPLQPGAHIKIAYFIMVHHKADVFKAMFAKIYSGDQFYLIHIDRKAEPAITEEIQSYIIQFPNVYLLESTNIVSGGFSMIQAELDAMEFLLNVSTEWDYFINLSGEDYPLKSQNIIRKFLTANLGRNYIFYYDQKFHRPDTLQRIQNHFTELTHKISSLVYKRDFMKEVIPYIGGKWFMLTRETCRFMTSNKKVMDFEDYYLHTFLPAESFFQTVFMNTSFKDVIVNDDKRAVIEKAFFSRKRSSEEFIEYLKSGNHLFVRKISFETDRKILDYMKQTYDLPLCEIDEIERELKTNSFQDN